MERPLFCLMLVSSLMAWSNVALANVEPVGAMPANNPGEWVTSDDYPPVALRSGIQGTTVFHLSIDQQGAVSGCDIVATSGSPDLDETACSLITQRARFNPATDENYRPVAGSYRSRVMWVIPKTTTPPTANFTVMHMVVERDGSASHCEIAIGANDNTQFAPRNCPAVNFKPYRTSSGIAVRKLVTTTITITVADDPD